MTSNRVARVAALTLVGTLALSGCAANERAADAAAGATGLSGTLNGIGSSAQATAQQAWSARFQKAHPALTVNYDPQGSGAGRTGFLSGAAAFAGSDAALTADEQAGGAALCEPDTAALNLPVYISPIAVAYTLEGVDDLVLDAATIAGIFSGAITRWDDAALVALNPKATLPDQPIVVVHRSDDSGTTENFTDYLATNAPEVWTAPASQTFPFPVGDAAKGTAGVAEATKNAPGAITYIDESGAAGLQTAALIVGERATTISASGAAGVVARSPLAAGEEGDLAVDIDRTDTAAGAWPLVLVSYMIVCDRYRDADTGTLVRAYLTHIAGAGAQQDASALAGSAPLPDELSVRVLAAAERIR